MNSVINLIEDILVNHSLTDYYLLLLVIKMTLGISTDNHLRKHQRLLNSVKRHKRVILLLYFNK